MIPARKFTVGFAQTRRLNRAGALANRSIGPDVRTARDNALFEFGEKLWQQLVRTDHMGIKSLASPLFKSESRCRRENPPRDAATRIVAFLDHVFWITRGLRVTFRGQQERCGVAILHPARFWIR